MQEEAVAVSQQREQLVLAEKLFGIDITSYPDLIQVCDVRLLRCMSACMEGLQHCTVLPVLLLNGCSDCILIAMSAI